MKKKMRFIIPSIITLIILLIIFFLKGLYPFTNNSLVQVDADYQFIPVLYRIYDFLHGNANIIYEDIGFGNNIYISMIIQGSIFSPLSLLLYFTSRSNIVNYFNIIVIVKMCLISFTTYLYINKNFRVNEYYKISFSVLYAFSGWVLLNYFNIMWMDSVILFPLIILFLNDLLDNGKYLGYVVTLSLSLIISYYISYFILLFILFYSFLYIFLKLEKGKIKTIIFKLGITTFTSIALSSFSLLPALYQTFLSSRIENSFDNTTTIFLNFMNKSLFLMFSSVFLVFFINLLFKYKRDKKKIYFYLILFILFSIGLFIEPINLGIHMGSYWGLPYRYSFITLFILMCGSLYYIGNFGIKGCNKNQIVIFVIFIACSLCLIYINNYYSNSIIDSQIILDFNNMDVYINILIIFLLIVVMTLISMLFRNQIFRYASFTFVCLAQIFIYSSWTMYYDEGYFLSKNSNVLNNNINIIKDDLKRYKMGYYYYTPDYGFVYDVNTLDNWLHILPSKQIDIYNKLGYGNDNTYLSSHGGTIFTDWLFNVGYLIDDIKYKDDDVYKLIDEYNDYYLYQYNYDNSFGFVYNKNNDFIIGKDINNFYLHNEIYKNLFNTDDAIIKVDNYNIDSNGSYTIDYKINELGFVYLDINDKIDYVEVNDREIYYDQEEGSIIEIGMYNKDINIKLQSFDFHDLNFNIGYIKYSDIMSLKSNVDDVKKVDVGYDINVWNDMDNGYLLLPINNINGLKAYINDREVKIENYLNNFVSIKLDKGNNNIKIRYEMPLFKIGIIFSISGLILLLLLNKIPNNKVVLNITCYVYIGICILTFLYYYGYSFFKYLGILNI